MKKHRLVYFGSSSFGLPTLDRLIDAADVMVVGVVSQPDQPTGRQKTVTSTPVATWAKKHNLPLITPPTLKSAEAMTEIKSFDADTFLVAAYGLILPPSVLSIPNRGCLNIHGSLLPLYRGASPVAAAILNGDQTTGISLMLMDKGIDTGPVLQQWSIPIQSDENAPQLMKRLAELAADNVPSAIVEWWNDKLQPRPQSGPASYVPQLRTSDGKASWQSAITLERKIRAYQPWPDVWTEWQGQRLKILSAQTTTEPQAEFPGTIISHPSSPGWAIVCGDGLLLPQQVQFAGKKTVLAASLPGSYPGFIGSRFD